MFKPSKIYKPGDFVWVSGSPSLTLPQPMLARVELAPTAGEMTAILVHTKKPTGDNNADLYGFYTDGRYICPENIDPVNCLPLKEDKDLFWRYYNSGGWGSFNNDEDGD